MGARLAETAGTFGFLLTFQAGAPATGHQPPAAALLQLSRSKLHLPFIQISRFEGIWTCGAAAHKHG